ncbi:MAG: PIG-L deacetylase family protein [Nostoc sp.]|uniref:PIG-L deacetylase family protein n=1 Tax=Nostoc sp. TaxID=1180 RepID=UPI002FF86123
MTILIVAAHPDDEVLGCGGTIAKLSSQGTEVATLILTNGEPSRNLNIQQQADNASDILGSLSPRILNFPDQRLDCVPMVELATAITNAIIDYKPEVVYTHFAGDLNLDHRLVFEATAIATRPTRQHRVQKLYSYHVPSSTEWAFGQLGAFVPNVFVGIAGKPLNAKRKAMSEYTKEVMEFPHPRSPEALFAIASSWGSVAGLLAAEAFILVREVDN